MKTIHIITNQASYSKTTSSSKALYALMPVYADPGSPVVVFTSKLCYIIIC